jgi:hypothetical protein
MVRFSPRGASWTTPPLPWNKRSCIAGLTPAVRRPCAAHACLLAASFGLRYLVQALKKESWVLDLPSLELFARSTANTWQAYVGRVSQQEGATHFAMPPRKLVNQSTQRPLRILQLRRRIDRGDRSHIVFRITRREDSSGRKGIEKC